MFVKRASSLIAALLLFCLFISGCNAAGTTDRPALSPAKSTSASPTLSSLTPPVSSPPPMSSTLGKSNAWEDEKYDGITVFEPTFNLDDFPVTYHSKYAIIRAANGCMTKQQMETAGKDVDTVIEQLQTYLETTLEKEWNTDHISIFIKPGELQRTVGSYSKPVVFLYPDNGELPLYAHEITHLLAGCKEVNSEWMVEGLAVYLNSIYSAYQTWPQYDQDIDTAAKSKMDYVKDLGFKDEYGYINIDPTTSYGEAYYTLAGSFVKYMIGKIGIQKYMAVYRSPSADTTLENETGKDISQWEAEWIDYLSLN